MMRAFLSLGFLFLLALPLHAQSSLDSPSMNAGNEDKRSSPFGINPLMKDRPKDAKTEITAKEEATFDNASSVAEFHGNVVVKDPQFTLFCDKLKVTLGKDRKGLETAEAIGNVIIVQEGKEENGKVVKSIGRAGTALYDPKSGTITLRLWPSVQHDVNLQVATEEGTVMVLDRAGKSKTTGPSKTMIVDSGEQKY